VNVRAKTLDKETLNSTPNSRSAAACTGSIALPEQTLDSKEQRTKMIE